MSISFGAKPIWTPAALDILKHVFIRHYGEASSATNLFDLMVHDPDFAPIVWHYSFTSAKSNYVNLWKHILEKNFPQESAAFVGGVFKRGRDGSRWNKLSDVDLQNMLRGDYSMVLPSFFTKAENVDRIRRQRVRAEMKRRESSNLGNPSSASELESYDGPFDNLEEWNF